MDDENKGVFVVAFAVCALLGAGLGFGIGWWSRGGVASVKLATARVEYERRTDALNAELGALRSALDDAGSRSRVLADGIDAAVIRATKIANGGERIAYLARALRTVSTGLRQLSGSGAGQDASTSGGVGKTDSSSRVLETHDDDLRRYQLIARALNRGSHSLVIPW